MNTPEQQLWNKIVDADTPSAAEMAAAEAELCTIESAPRLSASVVEALVERATGESAEQDGAVIALRRSSRFQLLFKLAAAVLVTLTLGWVGMELLWPEQKNAPQTLPYVDAVKLATQSWRGDEVQCNAMGIVADRCGYGIERISELAHNGHRVMIMREAQRIRKGLADLLTNGAVVPPGDVDQEPVGPAETALDVNLTDDVRLGALRHLGELVQSGLTAILVAPLSSDDANVRRRDWIRHLLKVLTD